MWPLVIKTEPALKKMGKVSCPTCSRPPGLVWPGFARRHCSTQQRKDIVFIVFTTCPQRDNSRCGVGCANCQERDVAEQLFKARLPLSFPLRFDCEPLSKIERLYKASKVGDHQNQGLHWAYMQVLKAFTVERSHRSQGKFQWTVQGLLDVLMTCEDLRQAYDTLRDPEKRRIFDAANGRCRCKILVEPDRTRSDLFKIGQI